MKQIDIAIDPQCKEPRILIPQHPSKYVDALEQRGYDQIRLTGLNALGVRYLNGGEGDEFILDVDSDARFLLSYYVRLEDIVALGRSEVHRVYLAGGCFEFSAFVDSERVRARVGVYRESTFAPPYDGTVDMPTREYLALWRGIAMALVRVAEKAD
ncbi:hypothetical protein [Myxococcus stipitatus]|uniref:hypothetical protein n=1 Tax=Myxococcus stipitatus TaxID=83455 RepID=UPI0030D3A51A